MKTVTLSNRFYYHELDEQDAQAIKNDILLYNQMLHKAYKFRIYPNESQKVLLAKTFGCVRLVYNHYLDLKNKSYEENRKSPPYTECASDLVQLKKEKVFLKEVDSIALQQSLRHLDTAYKNFFRDKKVGYPRFKSKKSHQHSYTTVCINNNIKLEDGKITLPKVGKVCIKQHRSIPKNYQLKSATVSMTSTDKYYVSLLYEFEENIQKVEIEKVIGLDYSMHDLFVASEEDVQVDQKHLHHYRKSLEQLAKEQRILSHRKKGSKRYEKQRIKVAKIHEKIANQRKDILHKSSRQIANAYDLVCVEDLNMKNMSQALNFGKSVTDNGWGMFVRFLEYKLEDLGKQLVKIDKWFPSSKTCHICGCINEELTLNIREWECPICHYVHHRDQNAAQNIKKEGMRIAFQ